MTAGRYAIYYAPASGSALDDAAARWLSRPDLTTHTVSARRYGFHATIKAPMRVMATRSPDELQSALAQFTSRHTPVSIGRLVPRLIDGFLALVPEHQSQELTDFAQAVVTAFEPFRAPLTADDLKRRLQTPLTDRQIELLDQFGYPYVGEEFRFHMTLTDRPEPTLAARLEAEARDWFAPALAGPAMLDRLVLFHEGEGEPAFTRLSPDYCLGDPI